MTDKDNTDQSAETLETEPTSPATEPAATVEERRSTEEIARAEAAEWRDKYVRKLAEFDNYRKRTRQELEMVGELVAEALISSLLPVMDDFDRLLTNVPSADDPYRKGVELIRNKLWSFFEARRVKVMDARGKPFDPQEHDALLMRPTPDFPPGTVLEVVTPGYLLGDRVIRHAQVIVSEEMKSESEPESA